MSTQINELQVTRLGGALPAGVSGADVYVADNDGNAVVQVYNPTGSPVTITEVAQATIAGLAVEGQTVTVAAGATEWIGPFPPVLYNDDLGRAHITDPSGALVFTVLRF